MWENPKVLYLCLSPQGLMAVTSPFCLVFKLFFFFRSIRMLPHITSKCNTRDLLLSPRARLSLFLEPHHHLLPSSRDLIRLMLTLVCLGGFQCQCAHCTVPQRQLWVNTCCDILLERPRGVCTLQWALWRRKERMNCAVCLCAWGRRRGDGLQEIYITKHPQVRGETSNIQIQTAAIKERFQDVIGDGGEGEEGWKPPSSHTARAWPKKERGLPFKDERAATLKSTEFPGIHAPPQVCGMSQHDVCRKIWSSAERKISPPVMRFN